MRFLDEFAGPYRRAQSSATAVIECGDNLRSCVRSGNMPRLEESRWIAIVSRVEAWIYTLTATVSLLAGLLCFLLSFAVHSFALGALGIATVIGTVAALPAYHRFEVAYSLLHRGAILVAGYMMVGGALTRWPIWYLLPGVAALVVFYYVLRPVVRQVEKNNLPKFLWWTRRRIPLERQLEEFAKCGIRLRSGFTVEDLPKHWTRHYLETHPYVDLLYAPGGYHDDAPHRDLSDDVWMFDTEFIVETGDYARIAEGYRDLAKGDLPIEDIEDHVDIAAGEAWLSFGLDGESYKWEATVEDDCADFDIYYQLQQLIENRATGRRFYSPNFFGQAWPIVCLTEKQAEHLISLGIPLA